jgi:adenosylcobinamide-phosphate synthase
MDLAIGDPEFLPHPVRWFGAAAERGERHLRPMCSGSSAELACGAVLTLSITAFAWLLGRPRRPLWQGVFAWTALATRSLLEESRAVVCALDAANLRVARERVARIVGRDTAHLDESEIARAVIETLAESACDGIVAPIFWLSTGGLSAGLAYKAVNTLDSMIGHREPPYRYFGRVAARLDDAANFIPARLTAFAIVCAAGFRIQGASGASRIWLRDGSKHASPNAGQSEAAMAGALGVRLGGENYYGGARYRAPLLNPEGRKATVQDAKAAIALTAMVSGLAFGVALLFATLRSRQ